MNQKIRKVEHRPEYEARHSDDSGTRLSVRAEKDDVDIYDGYNTASINYEDLPDIIEALKDIFQWWRSHDLQPKSSEEGPSDG